MAQQEQQQQQLPCSLQHFRHTLPGLTEGTGTRQKIERWPVLDLLEHELPVIIPLFQRKYCWEKAQGDKWWIDLLAIKPEFCKRGYGHVVGKVIFKVRPDEGLICIDGQQRTTTSSLLASAIKEGFLKKKRELLLSNDKQQQQQKQTTLLLLLDQLTARLDKYMFLKPEEARQWALDTWADWKTKSIQKEQPSTATVVAALHLDEYIKDGELLRFARLHPSHIDRQPYFQSIMSSMLLDTAEEAGVDLARDCPGGIRQGSLTEESMQGKMKKLFDSKVAAYFSVEALKAFAKKQQQQEEEVSGGSGVNNDPEKHEEQEESPSSSSALVSDGGSGSDIATFIAATELLLQQAFMGMSIIYVEVLHDVNLAQVFHYMQELHLFGFSALMFNPSPGLDFRASDLARNLLLAPTMNWKMQAQEGAHMRHWVGPIEGCYRRPVDIDRVLKCYLDEAEATDKKKEEEEKARVALDQQKQQKQPCTEEDRKVAEEVASDSNDSFFREIVGDVGGKKSSAPSADDGSPQNKNRDIKKPTTTTHSPKKSAEKEEEDHRYVSDFEKTVLKSINAFKKKKQVDGMLLYARFYSHYEKQLLQRWNNRSSLESSSSSSTEVVGVTSTSSVGGDDRGELFTESEQIEWTLDKEILERVGIVAARMKQVETNNATATQHSQ